MAGGEPILPPVEELLPEKETLGARATVHVREFRFEGNTAFTDEELAEALEPYTNRRLTSEELQRVRRALTLHYVEHGYVNSGAFLPDQTVQNGIVSFQVVEGRLAQVVVRGNARTSTEYIRDRVRPGRPLNVSRLHESLEVLRQDPIFRRLEAELQPGAEPGRSRLELEVTEARLWTAALEFANDQNPAVGSERFRLLLGHRNLSGVGNTLDVRYGLTTNGISDMEFAGLDNVSLLYTHPVTARDTWLILGFTTSDTLLIEAPFRDLDITSETEAYTVGVRHPLYRTPRSEFALSLVGEHRTNETELMGEPFSFEPGAEDGDTTVTALRFGQEWHTRDERRALAVQSTFTFGLPALESTDNVDEADSEFLAWLGQVRYVRRLGETDNRLILSASTQLANDSLLSLERFGVGGRYTVRGYRENQIVRDNGAVASAELRLPLLRDHETRSPVVQLAPFFDVGYGWNTKSPEDPEVLPSAGLGLLFNIEDRVDAELYWGVAMEDFDQAEHDLQDTGLHFRVTVGSF